MPCQDPSPARPSEPMPHPWSPNASLLGCGVPFSLVSKPLIAFKAVPSSPASTDLIYVESGHAEAWQDDTPPLGHEWQPVQHWRGAFSNCQRHGLRHGALGCRHGAANVPIRSAEAAMLPSQGACSAHPSPAPHVTHQKAVGHQHLGHSPLETPNASMACRNGPNYLLPTLGVGGRQGGIQSPKQKVTEEDLGQGSVNSEKEFLHSKREFA